MATLTSRTGKVHHAAGRRDGTLCNEVGESRGQVKWYVNKRGTVSCKSCLKALAKAEAEAYAWDDVVFAGTPEAAAPVATEVASTPRLRPSRAALAATGRAIHEEQVAAARSVGSSRLPQAQRTSIGDPHVATPAPAPQPARRPQINHKRCQHPQTPAARRACRTARRDAEAAAQYRVGQKVMVKLDDAPPMRAEITDVQARSFLRFGKLLVSLTYVVKTERTRMIFPLSENRVLHAVEDQA